MSARKPVECGTVRAYDRHLRRGETTCQPCRDAKNADYKARRDDPNGTTREQHRRYIAARGRALTRLANAHPEEMAALLASELGPADPVVRQPRRWKAA